MTQDQLIAIGQGVVFALVVLAWLWIAKLASDWRVRGRYVPDEQIEVGNNLAVALRQAGMYLGLSIGMLGALDGGGTGFVDDLVELAIDGAVLTLLMMAARILTDVVVVPGIRSDEALHAGNVAMGAVELGIFVATGLIANGSFSGEGGGLASALLFFVLGQAALLVLVRVYEAVTPWRVIQEVERGNASAGVMLAGTLVAFGFILRTSLAGPFVSWTADLAGFALYATAATVLLMVLQLGIDRLFLPTSTLHKEIEEDANVAAISVAAAVKVALALVIAGVI